MLLRLYNDDSPLVGIPMDKTEQTAKGSTTNMKVARSADVEIDHTLNGTADDHDERRGNTSSEQEDD